MTASGPATMSSRSPRAAPQAWPRAASWSRFHHQWLPDELRLEGSGFSPDTIRLLESRGHRLRVAGQQGESAAIQITDAWLLGAADSRTEGTARGY